MEQEKKLKIAAIQMSSKIADVKANINKVRELINRDVEKNTDVIILPEVWTVGWSCKDFRNSAEEIQTSKTVKFLSEIAKKYNSFVIGGSFIEKETNVNDETGVNDEYYNTCVVINREGKLIAKYSKNHLFSYYGCGEGDYLKAGKNPVMVTIDGIKIGLTICYDIRFPEIFRAYRKAGADVIVNCAAWGLKKPVPWECMTRCRAVENQVYFVALTQSGQIDGEEWNIGHSRILDYKGETITEITDQKEGTMSAEINFNQMYDFREKCTVLKDIKKNYEVEIL